MESFVAVLTVFVLAMFVGWMVITKVPPLLHTPLMSGSNAISGITLIGALLSAGAFVFQERVVIDTLARKNELHQQAVRRTVSLSNTIRVSPQFVWARAGASGAGQNRWKSCAHSVFMRLV